MKPQVLSSLPVGTRIEFEESMAKLQQLENVFIGIAGMIGAGKSTLAKSLGEHLEIDVYYEPIADNEYLEDFYRDTPRYCLRRPRSTC